MFDAKRFFQVAVAGILAQGKQCKAGVFYGVCCYRNKYGERCVVGMAIPPDKYTKSMDDEDAITSCDEDFINEHVPSGIAGIYAHQNPFVLQALKEEYGSPIKQDDLDLMKDIQEVHDEVSDAMEWPKRFRQIEEKFFGEESDLCGLKEKTNA